MIYPLYAARDQLRSRPELPRPLCNDKPLLCLTRSQSNTSQVTWVEKKLFRYFFPSTISNVFNSVLGHLPTFNLLNQPAEIKIYNVKFRLEGTEKVRDLNLGRLILLL